jgi:predicted O-linked N-acetylglucosamine transferase (SPINDLY family)
MKKNAKNKKINLLENEPSLIDKGLAHHKNGDLEKAENLYREVLKINPNSFDALNLLGSIEGKKNNYEESLNLFDKAVSINPNNESIYNNRANVLISLGRHNEALDNYNYAISLNPKYAEALNNRGSLYQKLDNPSKARQSFEQALSIEPQYFDALFNLAHTLNSVGNLNMALALIKKALSINPSSYYAHNVLGKLLFQKKEYQAAIKSYTDSIQVKEDYLDAYNGLALALDELGELNMAEQSLNTALMFNSRDVDTYINKGKFYEKYRLYDLALENYIEAIKNIPDNCGFLLNKGNILKKMFKYDEALLSYENAKSLDPNYVEAYNNIAIIYQELRHYDKALAIYSQAITIQPNNSETLFNFAELKKELQQFDDAILNYEKAYSINPSYPYLLGELLFCKMYICDWKDFNLLIKALTTKLFLRERVIQSFSCVTLIDSALLHKIAAQIYVKDKIYSQSPILPIEKASKKNKIKVGYYSADFYNHATSYLMAQLFEKHDKDKFEIIAFSFGEDRQDEMRKRLLKGFDQFINVQMMSDLEIVQLSRQLQIDIAIDLKGYTQWARPQIFSIKVAPIQVNYLGYPGTMGADFIDYIIADKILIPKESMQYYSEKIIYLPHSYQVNDSQRVISCKAQSRLDFGLPEHSIVYVSFNSIYKINPNIFDVWMRILNSVEGSVLWLLEENLSAVNNLRYEAQKRGIASKRLIFAPRISTSEHLARYKLADLFLDTLPCNSHTTASDALWAGLPLLTCIGESFASRVASSILTAMELSQLITISIEEYESKAIYLGLNPDELKKIRCIVEENISKAPLFDIQLFTRNLEAAYQNIYNLYHADLPPKHIYIED